MQKEETDLDTILSRSILCIPEIILFNVWNVWLIDSIKDIIDIVPAQSKTQFFFESRSNSN